MKLRLLLVLLLLTAVWAGWRFLTPQPIKQNEAPRQVLQPTDAPRNEIAPPASPMAAVLMDKDASPEEELRALGDIFRYITLEPSGQIPTGTNREITRRLTEPNELGVPYVPANHPAINSDGELIDRWDTPYFFHALSSKRMEIRSAGPDQSMHTEDDLIWPPRTAPHQTRQATAIDLGL